MARVILPTAPVWFYTGASLSKHSAEKCAAKGCVERGIESKRVFCKSQQGNFTAGVHMCMRKR